MQKTFYLFIIYVFIFFLCCADKQSHLPGKPFHHIEGGFRNPPGSIEPVGSFFVRLLFNASRPFVELYTPAIPNDHVLDHDIALKEFYKDEENDSITWIGHSTVILRMGKQIIAIDPWFSDWATNVPPFGPKREVPPGIPLDKLLQFNVIVISHNHYDHLDIATLKRLQNPDQIAVIVPIGVSRYIKKIRFKEVIELDWYESKDVNNILYTALPVVHNSRRGLFDKNETLWAGFSIKSPNGKKVFFCEGEYGEIYKQIGQKYGPFDIALITAGAYMPRKYMQGSHCIPENCVQIALDIRAENIAPVHWGTVIISTEGFMEPGYRVREEAIKKGVREENIWIMKIGETRRF